MDSDASSSPVPSSNQPSNSEEPVKIKEEVVDPGYNSASTAFEVTTRILASDIKMETEIKKEIKWEPMDASENENQNQPKMPLPKVELKKSEDTQTPLSKTPLQMQRARLRYFKKHKKNVAYEPASSSGYYPPASVIWQRVPYLKPRHKKYLARHHYKWNRQNLSSQKHNSPNRSQPNTDHSTSPLYTVNVEDSSPSDDNIDNENPLSNSTETSDKACFFMFVENLPVTWNEAEVKEFLVKENISVKEFEMMKYSDSKFTGTIQIEFETFEQREEAKKKLHGKDVEGKTLTVELIDSSNLSDSDSEYSEPSIKRKKVNIEDAYRPEIDVWEKDPKGLYGLKPEFLESLGIKPPIGRWVQVTNFRCNKPELKDVMDLAGDVLLCTVLTMSHISKVAKVMYSHPLEAVQAVSMLNKKMFYGTQLNVTMEHCPDRHIILPKGLQEVGPGLGQNGIPLIDIVRHYERFAKSRSSSIDMNIFRDINFKMDSSDCDIDLKTASSDIGSVQPKNEPESDKPESNGPLLPNPCNPIVNPNIIITCTGGPMSGTSGPMPGPSGPISGSSGPMPGPSGPVSGPSGPISGPSGLMSGSSGPMSGPSGAMPGPSVSMSGPRVPMSGSSGLMSGSSGPMSGPSGRMPGPSGPISRPCGPMSGISGPNGPMSGLNSPMPVNGGPIRNQMRPNISPMPYPMPMRPGFGPNQNQGPMMAQASRIPRQMGPMAGQMGPVAGHFQVPGPPGHFPVQSQIPNPMVNQPGPMVNPPRPIVNSPRPMANQPNRFPNQPHPPGVSDNSPRKPGPVGPGPRPMIGNNVPAMTMNSANCPGPIPQSSQGNCTVEISNLPPNTTFPFLSEKLSSCGPLMSLQMNRDRALAQFATRGHAENCYKQFNQLKVFGNTLQVKFV